MPAAMASDRAATATSSPAPAAPEAISFEVERFELTDDERVEVTGRWFGIRGRRFVRPSLIMAGADGTTRSLALLEHKPWAADDGEEWTAAFPVEGGLDDLGETALAVAPDIAVPLPTLKPGRERSGNGGARAKRSDGPARRKPRRKEATPRSQPRREPAIADGELALVRDERDALRRAVEFERGEALRLRGELDQARAAKIENESVLARRDAALVRLDEVTAERDDALATAARARGELEQTLREVARLQAESGRLREEREQAFAGLDAALERARADAEATMERRLSDLREEVERERAGAGRMAEALRDRDATTARAGHVVRVQERSRDARALWLRRVQVLVPLLCFLLVLLVLVRSS